MPERYHAGVQGPYFKDRFVYNTATISYICPQGQRLPAHIGVALPALTQVRIIGRVLRSRRLAGDRAFPPLHRLEILD